MLFKESGLLKALKAAHRVGYEIIPDGERVTICTKNWAINADRADLPLKASLALVEHAGYMPNAPIKVCGGTANQTVFADLAKVRMSEVDTGSGGEWQPMKRLPITYKDRWKLFISQEHEVFAFDEEILDVLDTDMVAPTAMLRTGYVPAGVFELGGNYLMAAPGKFSAEDSAKLIELAKLGWEDTRLYGDPCENMCLFEMEDYDE